MRKVGKKHGGRGKMRGRRLGGTEKPGARRGRKNVVVSDLGSSKGNLNKVSKHVPGFKKTTGKKPNKRMKAY